MDVLLNKNWLKYQKAFRTSPEYEICLNAFVDHAVGWKILMTNQMMPR